MLERDWLGFLKQGAGKEIAIAHVAAGYVEFLGAESNKLYLHHDYARKAAEKHGLTGESFNMIWDAMEYGTAISDRPNHVTFFYRPWYIDRWIQVSIKCPADSKRLYLVTFHRVNARKMVNKLEKFAVISKEKRAE